MISSSICKHKSNQMITAWQMIHIQKRTNLGSCEKEFTRLQSLTHTYKHLQHTLIQTPPHTHSAESPGTFGNSLSSHSLLRFLRDKHKWTAHTSIYTLILLITAHYLEKLASTLLRIKVPKGCFCSDALHPCMFPCMFKVLHRTLDANKEPLFWSYLHICLLYIQFTAVTSWNEH